MLIKIPNNSLIAMVGISGSGKDYFANKYFKSVRNINAIVSSDKCRIMLHTEYNNLTQQELQKFNDGAFTIFHAMIEAKLKHNQLTVANATNLSPESRHKLEEIAKASHVPIYYIVMNTPLETCIERDNLRDEFAKVGESVVKKHATRFKSAYSFLEKQNNVFIVNPEDEITVELLDTNNIINIDHGIDIIGDVHGTFSELNELLGKLGYIIGGQKIWHPSGRKIVFVGDIADRGPDNWRCLELARHMMENNTGWWVMSNHDNKLMRWLSGRKVRIADGLQKTIDQIPEEAKESLREFMYKNLKSYYHFKHTNGEEIVVTHGAFNKKFIGKYHRDISDYCMYGPTQGEDDNGHPIRIDWARSYTGPFVVFGHAVCGVSPKKYKNAINIDTGAVFGGMLSSYSFPAKEIVQVKSKQIYDGSKPELFEIQENTDLTIQDMINTSMIEVENHRGEIINLRL